MAEALFVEAVRAIALSWIYRSAKKPDSFVRYFIRGTLCVI
jgi:hypothetical protein